MRMSSITTGGCWVLALILAGSITATPPIVGNHSLPSRVLIPAGQVPPLHSELGIPAPWSNARPVKSFARGVRKIDQFLFAYTIDAAIAAHPEPAIIVFQDLEDAVIIQPIIFCVARKAPILKPPQAAVIRPDP